MKHKRWIAALLILILLVTSFPTSSAKADELADGQTIADGVYYIQNNLSGNFMTVADGALMENGALYGTTLEGTSFMLIYLITTKSYT